MMGMARLRALITCRPSAGAKACMAASMLFGRTVGGAGVPAAVVGSAAAQTEVSQAEDPARQIEAAGSAHVAMHAHVLAAICITRTLNHTKRLTALLINTNSTAALAC